ncbi:innexin unc-9-like isoform X2 [Brachionus plicatilis]|uniref:Innexin n=1 Tax=Brachionus plicatilis TaxID=10195 RepID=A0A3M7RU27_BRAPC|nr:innexin unc-9-like isoform X2 [Brachionus plicatilis]
MDLVHYITKFQNVFAVRNDDDVADRLNYRYTVAILVAFAIIVSHRQFSESVIKCWVPAFFTPNYEAYANQVCWISNTYYVNQSHNVPNSEETRKSGEIKYYQWIPFILLIQALFLYIPRVMWRLLSARAGLDMRDLIEAAHSYKSVEKFANKKKIMEYIVQNIDQYASNPRRSKSRDSIFQKIKYFGESLFCGSGIYLGNYLVTTYFFIKIVYLINSIFQFFVMNEFLGKQFHELGIDILRYLTNTYSLDGSMDSVYFPKVVMCDFRIREFGHPNFSHRYTIQCVLPINLYNQQIFTFLWFWFLILFFANCWALCQWVNRMLPSSRWHYINKRLNMLKHFRQLNQSTSIVMQTRGIFRRRKSVSLEAKRQKRKFIDDYLKFDGVFILRMISMLTSEIVCTELLHELWKKRAVNGRSSEDCYSLCSESNVGCARADIEPVVIYENGKVGDRARWRSDSLPVSHFEGLFDFKSPETVPEGEMFIPRRRESRIKEFKQQVSVDLASLKAASAIKRTRLSELRKMSNENDVERAEGGDHWASSPRTTDSIKSKNKKVNFAKIENQEQNLVDTSMHFSDIECVFSDLKFDH